MDDIETLDTFNGKSRVLSRWHIEYVFNQWTRYRNLEYVFRHTPNAVQAVTWIWMLAFNLFQLFAYCRLRRPRVPLPSLRHDPRHRQSGRRRHRLIAPTRSLALLLDTR